MRTRTADERTFSTNYPTYVEPLIFFIMSLLLGVAGVVTSRQSGDGCQVCVADTHASERIPTSPSYLAGFPSPRKARIRRQFLSCLCSVFLFITATTIWYASSVFWSVATVVVAFLTSSRSCRFVCRLQRPLII